MNSKEYWRKREDEALTKYKKSEAEYDKEIERIYADMLDRCNEQINAFYGKYAKAEGISIAEAKKRVKTADIKEYERKAAKYVRDAELDRKANGGKTNKKGYYFSPKAEEEMRLYNTMMKINRLEMLKANIGLETIRGHDELDKFMGEILQGRTQEELERQAGILGKSVKNSAKYAHTIPNASFHNATFSDRIWQYQDLMREDLSKILSRGLIQGKNPRAIAKDLRKYWYGNDPKTKGGAVYCMERLMRTEMARVQTEAQKQSFERNGFEQYEFIANSDCCDICKSLDGKHFKVKDMMPGENAAPVHPHCRCSVAAYSDDAEYEAWLDYVSNGGTTDEWEKFKHSKIRYTPAKGSQNFKPIVYDGTDTVSTSYKDLPCSATKVVGFDNDLYISDKLKLKPKQVNYVNARINKAVSLVGAKSTYTKPRIIICDSSELPSKTIAAYTAKDNTLRLSSIITSKSGVLSLPKDGACYDNHNSVYVHEMLHWSDAQEYIRTHGTTNGYLEANIKTGKKHIDKLLKNGYNIDDFSGYAKNMLDIERYDEVWTEYRTEQILKE